MSVRFNADEIFEMAEQIETNGEKFYRRAAEVVSEPDVRKLVMGLAEAEVQHRKTFADMRSQLVQQEKGGAFLEPDEELSSYLRVWADGHVFDLREDPAKRVTADQSAAGILRTALGMEKDSIVFYLLLKDSTPKKWGQDKIDDIINEELKHVAIISTQISELEGKVN